MKQHRLGLVAFLGLLLVVSGCSKKSTDQASISGTGFESVSSPADLAQLPQATTAGNQQSAIEVLPIETSPVTQGVPGMPLQPNMANGITNSIPTADAALNATLSHNQQIQTALKNAGVYEGAIDGKIGPASKRAIESFQKSNGLKADGKVGSKTWKTLEPYINGTASTPTPAESIAASSSTVAKAKN